MKVDFSDYNGVRIIIYRMDEDETIPWHDHAWNHGHVVIEGRTRIEIRGEDSVVRIPGMDNLNLLAGIEHQITALEDDTIFLQPMVLP